MNIVVAGGTGFLGAPLVSQLRAGGNEVFVLTRGRSAPGQITWSPDGTAGPWAAAIDGADAVINLAGESIAGHRWTAAHKARIRDSRIAATRSIVAAIHAAARRPAMLVNASAVGYYGSRGHDTLTEESGPGEDFLATVCVAWEAEAMCAADASRVIVLRSAPVLGSGGGVLPQMAMPFRLLVGGPIGDGTQYWPWIHRDDWVALVRWTLEARHRLEGPLNVASPAPVTNREFAAALGRALGRPAFMPTPTLALRLAVGEMADVLLSSQRVIPAKASALGFQFRYAALDPALAAVFRAD